jgi:hypothetical protein
MSVRERDLLLPLFYDQCDAVRNALVATGGRISGDNRRDADPVAASIYRATG